jgi:uncharacterized protein
MTISDSLPYGFHVLAKPTGAVCNLDCKYCFFLSKELLYPGSRFRMADDLLADYIRQLLEGQRSAPEVNIAWQGGEPTLMGLDFFRRVVELALQYRQPGQHILHSIQTNGTRLNDEWAAFFRQHNFLVGLSVDGPQPLHDAYRVDKGGRGTFEQVMRGWQVLRQRAVDANILCTVHAANAEHPLDVYRFFRDELMAEFIQFIPIIERATPETLPIAEGGWTEGRPERPLYVQYGDRVTTRSVQPEQYGRFMNAIFDEWVRRDVGRVYVQAFDVALGAWLGQYTLCIHTPTCGNALALEHNGDLYSCDHFVEPDYLLGNIRETPMIELVASPKQRQFGQDKLAKLPAYCRNCDVRFACHGGCPKDRFLTTPDGEPGLHYLCAGYKAFFHHITEAMNFMAEELRHNRAPAGVMAYVARQDAAQRAAFAKAGRNDPCPCGSGKKYKQCHGKVAS